MARKEAKVSYDEEEDILYVYSGENVKDSIEVDNFVFDLSMDDKIIGVEIFNASKILRSWSGLEITKDNIASIRAASISMIQQRELIFAKIVLLLNVKDKKIEVTIPAPLPKIAVTI